MKPITLPHHYKRRTYRQQTRLSNIVLMPANLLAKKAHYTSVANRLPDGSVLICTPPPVFSKQQQALAKVASYLKNLGHHVTTLPASQIAV